MDQPTGRSDQPTREECATIIERETDALRAIGSGFVCAFDAAAAYLREDAARIAELEAERDALVAQVASLRKALEWLWGEGVVVFEAMTDDNGSSLWTVDLEPVGCDDTDIFYRSLSAATGVPVKHLWLEAEESDEQ